MGSACTKADDGSTKERDLSGLLAPAENYHTQIQRSGGTRMRPSDSARLAERKVKPKFSVPLRRAARHQRRDTNPLDEELELPADMQVTAEPSIQDSFTRSGQSISDWSVDSKAKASQSSDGTASRTASMFSGSPRDIFVSASDSNEPHRVTDSADFTQNSAPLDAEDSGAELNRSQVVDQNDSNLTTWLDVHLCTPMA